MSRTSTFSSRTEFRCPAPKHATGAPPLSLALAPTAEFVPDARHRRNLAFPPAALDSAPPRTHSSERALRAPLATHRSPRAPAELARDPVTLHQPVQRMTTHPEALEPRASRSRPLHRARESPLPALSPDDGAIEPAALVDFPLPLTERAPPPTRPSVTGIHCDSSPRATSRSRASSRVCSRYSRRTSASTSRGSSRTCSTAPSARSSKAVRASADRAWPRAPESRAAHHSAAHSNPARSRVAESAPENRASSALRRAVRRGDQPKNH